MRGQRQAISRGRSPWLPDWPLCGHAGHGGSLSRCVQPHRAAFTPSPPSEASSEPGHSLEVTARDRHDLQEARFPPPCCALPVGFPHQGWNILVIRPFSACSFACGPVTIRTGQGHSEPPSWASSVQRLSHAV
ncbi:uncharacterized protein LOC107153114 isoform X2 [Marmota marmota marmota]|uniref:uncharacterized protein LOC107153114 isoform X2 n=1 Tax=Marmota marmota marmota TaxID=9994 RepID=UPI002093DBBE|nr:uncharacterized protein LOC107153114 isoform X2 [Marmota marmota marmota]